MPSVVFRISLDSPATELGDMSETFVKGKCRYSFSTTFAVDEETGDTPVWKLAQSLFIGLLAPDVGEFRGRSELAPSHGVWAIENECCVSPAFSD